MYPSSSLSFTALAYSPDFVSRAYFVIRMFVVAIVSCDLSSSSSILRQTTGMVPLIQLVELCSHDRLSFIFKKVSHTLHPSQILGQHTHSRISTSIYNTKGKGNRTLDTTASPSTSSFSSQPGPFVTHLCHCKEQSQTAQSRSVELSKIGVHPSPIARILIDASIRVLREAKLANGDLDNMKGRCFAEEHAHGTLDLFELIESSCCHGTVQDASGFSFRHRWLD